MKDTLQTHLATIVRDLFAVEAMPEFSRPDPQFGDFATNIALQLAGRLHKNPREIAEAIQGRLAELDAVASVRIAGPGFINLTLKDGVLAAAIAELPVPRLHEGTKVVIEHTDPNPFKPFHIGHAYSNTIGEALARLHALAGAEVKQVSYHGDVGLHVAMAVWAMQRDANIATLMLSTAYDLEDAAAHLGACYARGALAFKEDEVAAEEIRAINRSIYARDNDDINRLYDWGKDASFKYFDIVYRSLGTGFADRYLESETGAKGAEIVRAHIGDVFEESDGAIVYRGEQDGLHTRVFLNSQGLPTYEAKELGLAFMKEEKEHPERMVVVTGNEIDEYFRVLTAVLKRINPELGAKIRHVSHGMVRLPEGKMSSRTGKVKLATEVLTDVRLAISQAGYGADPAVLDAAALGAIKYSFLKHRIGGDLVFDIDESISLEGNSGPYLQYAHARARSILAKAAAAPVTADTYDAAERQLALKLSEYGEVLEAAARELMPHLVATYLYELAQTFNRFYETSRIVGDPREAERLQLVARYAETLRHGLQDVLNIPAPEHM